MTTAEATAAPLLIEPGLLAQFSARQDVFAEQHDDGSWEPVRRELTEDDLAAHLDGSRTFGLYLLDTDSRARCAVLDIDVPKAWLEDGRYDQDAKRQQFEAAGRLSDTCKLLFRADPLIEASGRKGLHLWMCFAGPPIDAMLARLAAERLLAETGFTRHRGIAWKCDRFPAAHIECFPKQDRLTTGGFGNLVKLPLGVHRVTGRRSIFLDRDGRQVKDADALLGSAWQ